MTSLESVSSGDPLDRIFAYRAIDLRDRFPQPLETFREALECLQSDRSYMAAMSGDIIAYLRGGYSLTVPDHFFLRRRSDIDATLVPPDQNDGICDEVEAWLQRTLVTHEKDMLEKVLLEDRPYSLDQKMQRCELALPEAGDVRQRLDAHDVGSKVPSSPCEKEVWLAAEGLFGSREGAKRWMLSPAVALNDRAPADVALEDAQQVYDLIMRLEYGVYT